MSGFINTWQEIFVKIKERLASIICGNNFQIVGATLFSNVDAPTKKKVLAYLPGDAHVTELSIVETFTLKHIF